MGDFSATVNAWVKETKARQEAVFKEAAQRVVEVMQTPGPSVANPTGGIGGHMPIDTGFLRASLQAVRGSNPAPLREAPPGDLKHAYDAGEVNLVIAGAQLSDTITVAYTAKYAPFVNYRYQFVGLAAQQWQQIVDDVATEAKARAGG